MDGDNIGDLRVLVASLLPDAGHLTPLFQIGRRLQQHGAEVCALIPAEAEGLVQQFGIPYQLLGTVLPDKRGMLLKRLSNAGDFSRALIREASFHAEYILPLTANGIGRFPELAEQAESFEPNLILADAHIFSQEYRELASRVDCPLVMHYSKGNHYYLQQPELWSRNRSRWTMKCLRTLRKMSSPLHYKLTKYLFPEEFKKQREMSGYVREFRAGYGKRATKSASVTEITTGIAVLEKIHLAGRINTWNGQVKIFGPMEPVISWKGGEKLQQWLDLQHELSVPVVFLAFGTMVGIPEGKATRIAKVAVAQGCRVLVAGRDRIKSLLPLESTGDLYWSDWVPQVAVLDHPAVKGFISHGGSTSVQEALWFGKPILCVPVLWDQFYSSWIAEQLGFGVWADGIGSPRRSVHWKVDKLINDSTIRTRAVALSLEIRRHPGDLEVVEELACVARASKKEWNQFGSG